MTNICINGALILKRSLPFAGFNGLGHDLVEGVHDPPATLARPRVQIRTDRRPPSFQSLIANTLSYAPL